MASKAYSTGASWSFPSDLGHEPQHKPTDTTEQMPGTFTQKPESRADAASQDPNPSSSTENAESHAKSSSRRRTHWPPRTCRICLETVQPTFSQPVENVPQAFQPAPNVTYSSPDLGRLLRPCKCKGSSKYVHEGCLQAWRHADPSYGKRNYWQCPTCSYRYQLERMNWGNWISSAFTQLSLTGLIFLIAIFLLGFIADPIINFYTEPYAVFYAPRSLGERIDSPLSENNVPTWLEHFLKGFASLGLLGFVKAIVTLSPWNWFNIRVGGSGRPATGRDRLSNISWFVVLIGVLTFLWVSFFLHFGR